MVFASLLTAANSQVTFTGIRATGNFGSQGMGSPSAAVSLPFTIASGTTVGSIGVLTQGAPNLDFIQSTGTTCTAMQYSSPTNCVINVEFKPRFAGSRMGAVVFFSGLNNTGTVLARIPVWGIGIGAQIAFSPGNLIEIRASADGQALSSACATAVDGAGNLFIADCWNNRVVEIPAGGGDSIALNPTVNGAALAGPAALAVDGAGDLFLADFGNDRVVEIPVSGTAIAISPTVDGKAMGRVTGVAVDGAGNLFVQDRTNGRVIELPADGGAAYLRYQGPNTNDAEGLAVDGAGNLFIAREVANQVTEVPVGGGPATAIKPTVNGIGLNGPCGVAVDGLGNLFIADTFNYRVIEVPSSGMAATSISPMINGTQVNEIFGLAVDSAGNMFIGDHLRARVVEVQRSQASVTFEVPTVSGSTDINNGTKIEQVQNMGNADLTFTDLIYPADFPAAAGDTNACTDSSMLSAGDTCDLPIQFHPLQTGYPLNNEVNFTMTTSNLAQVTEMIPVSGWSYVPPSLIAPAAGGSKLPGPNVIFSWTHGQGVQAYGLRLGNHVGGSDIYQSPVISDSSFTVTGVPTSGSVIFATLGFKVNGFWLTNSYGYTEANNTAAEFLNPVPNGQLPGSQVTFTWTAGQGATAYGLRLGHNVGANDLYQSATLASTSVSVTGLPTDGKPIYATLGYKVAGVWKYSATTYTAGVVRAALTRPTPGSTLTGSSVTFIWTAAPAATGYALQLGSMGVGSSDLFSSGFWPYTSATATGLPTDGSTIYARLGTKINGTWYFSDSTYTTQ